MRLKIAQDLSISLDARKADDLFRMFLVISDRCTRDCNLFEKDGLFHTLAGPDSQLSARPNKHEMRRGVPFIFRREAARDLINVVVEKLVK